MKNVYYFIWLSLIVLLGIGSLSGSVLMLTDPSGNSINMSTVILENSPFKDFFVPAVLLLIFFGIIPLLLLRPLLKKSYSRFFEGLNILTDMQWPWTFSIYVSMALIIWIQVQMEMLREVNWIHTLFTFWGLAILALGLMPAVRLRYKKNTENK